MRIIWSLVKPSLIDWRRSMKFLVDVNASGATVTLLTTLGHDVAQVITVDERMSDDAILQWALTEDRIAVTTDQDFEEMIWREQKNHCGVLRLENLPRAARKVLLEDGTLGIAKWCVWKPRTLNNRPWFTAPPLPTGRVSILLNFLPENSLEIVICSSNDTSSKASRQAAPGRYR